MNKGNSVSVKIYLYGQLKKRNGRPRLSFPHGKKRQEKKPIQEGALHKDGPVSVPDKTIASQRMLDFIDRCHSLTSLALSPAALGSFPPS